MHSVLITGGAGFIGQNLVHAWRVSRPGDRLVVVDKLTYAAHVKSLERLIADRSIDFVQGDICDAVLLQRLFATHSFNRVAHLAAESHVDRSIADPQSLSADQRSGHLQPAEDRTRQLAGGGRRR